MPLSRFGPRRRVQGYMDTLDWADDCWQAIRRGVLARHRYSREVDTEIRIVLGFGEPTVRVPVRVRRHGEAVLILAEVADDLALPPMAALRWNAELPIGALVLVGRTYAVRALIPFTDAQDGVGLERRLQAVATAASLAKRRSRAAGKSGETEPFANYAE